MPAKKAAPKRSQAKRRPTSRRPSSPSDGQTMLITSYFEIENKQGAVGADTKLSYSIKCDPRNCKLQIGENAVLPSQVGISAKNGSGSELIQANQQSGDLTFLRFSQFAPLYRQYKLNSVKVESMVDRECGLENPVNFSTDKDNSAPADNIGVLVGAAHKQLVMTESRRLAKYGWKPKDSQDRDYRNMNQTLDDDDAHFIKCFQEIEAKDNGSCKHRVTVTMSVTLKDTTGTAVSLN